jgi:hypothetical protein
MKIIFAKDIFPAQSNIKVKIKRIYTFNTSGTDIIYIKKGIRIYS